MAEYRLFYRALLQKRPVNLRSLLIVATPYLIYSTLLSISLLLILLCKRTLKLIFENVYLECYPIYTVFSTVSSLLNLPYAITEELTFEKTEQGVFWKADERDESTKDKTPVYIYYTAKEGEGGDHKFQAASGRNSQKSVCY